MLGSSANRESKKKLEGETPAVFSFSKAWRTVLRCDGQTGEGLRVV